MAFFTEQWIICNMSEKDVLVARKKKNNIILERIVGDLELDKEIQLADDVLLEYDIDLNSPNKIYFLYQNQEKHLILKVIQENNIEVIKLTSNPIGDVIDLNIKVIGRKIHILYTMRIPNQEYMYYVLHHYYDGASWRDYIVEEIHAKKVLNPIKAIKKDENILLSYYKMDNEIALREFNTSNMEWTKETIISDTNEEKLFLDMILIEDKIHLTYCEYMEGSLSVRYKMLDKDNEDYKTHFYERISNEGSQSYPNIILFNKKLWVTWVEHNKIISRVSENMGESWEGLYQWDDSRSIDFLRYKYLTMEEDENVKLDYSFGSIYPKVKLMGFGPTTNTTTIPLKKNQPVNTKKI